MGFLDQRRGGVGPGVTQAIQLRVDLPEPVDAGSEGVQLLPPIRRRGPLPDEAANAARHEPLSLGGLGHLPQGPAPRLLRPLHHLLQRTGHLTQEASQRLVHIVRRPLRGHAPGHQLGNVFGGEPAILQLLGSEDAVQGSPELAYVLESHAGQALRDAGLQGATPLLHLPPDDGDAGFELRSRDVHDQAPGEAGHEPRVQAIDLGGRTIAGQDDLGSRRGECVQGGQHHLLRLLLARQELDVVHEEQVQGTVLVPQPVSGPGLQRVLQFHQVLLQGLVADVQVLSRSPHVVGDGAQDVGLAQARRGIDEEGIVAGSR